MSTETKHTPSPGPWTIERNVAAGNVIHLAVTARQNGSDWMVCSITPMAWVRPIDLANAALIASAPDMAREIAQLKAEALLMDTEFNKLTHDKAELLAELRASEFTMSAMTSNDPDLANQVEKIRALIAKHSK